MPTCVPADDAYLIGLWPGVVFRTPERWLVAIDGPAAQTGVYGVTMLGLPYEYAATVPPDVAADIRNQLLVTLGTQIDAAASAQGISSLLLTEVPPPALATPPGLDVTVAGPAAGTITATLISGGDVNAATRALWLEATLCCLPACCVFGACAGDYTRMHAALAAALIYQNMPSNIGSTGASVNDFERMRLGPAELSKGGGALYRSGTIDGMLAQTAPGQYFLRLRARYVFPIICA